MDAVVFDQLDSLMSDSGESVHALSEQCHDMSQEDELVERMQYHHEEILEATDCEESQMTEQEIHGTKSAMHAPRQSNIAIKRKIDFTSKDTAQFRRAYVLVLPRLTLADRLLGK